MGQSNRVGFGFDCHNLIEGRPLVLAGTVIPYERGLAGHSDADVLTHAVMDALLGAAGLGDIGEHFPDSDQQWKDSSSIDLAVTVVGLLSAAGWGIVNVDSTVVLEEPRLSGHKQVMRQRLAAALGLELEAVSVKATTNEGMGFIGRGDGAAAFAVALIERRD